MAAKETLETFYRAIAIGDVTRVLGLLDDNVEWTEAAGFLYAGTYYGAQAVLSGVFTRVAHEWQGYEVEPSQLVAEGDEVVSLGTYRGTYKATGKSFSARFAHSVTVKCGKIVRFEQVVDTAEVNKAF
jgi:ketosteroid isomerase-like protein